MDDNSWKYLINPNAEMLGLKNDTTNMKKWLNEIVMRIESITDDSEAIKTLFTINQKVGYVKGKDQNYYYPDELYRKLEITINKLLQKRLNKLFG